VWELAVGNTNAALEGVRERAEATAEDDANLRLDGSSFSNREDRVFDTRSDRGRRRLRGVSHARVLGSVAIITPAARRAI
jgi:hypothetical protein